MPAMCLASRKNTICKALIYGFFTLFLFLQHLWLPMCGDDAYLLPLVGVRSIPEHFAELYRYNGKIFTDFTAFLFYHLPYVVWKIFNTGVFLAVAILLAQLFTQNTVADALVVCALVAIFPLGYLGTAGYIATCANYLYPLCGLLFIAWQLKRLLYQKEHWVWQFFSLPVMAYVLNQDQAACILVGGLLLALIACFLQHRSKQATAWIAGYFLVALAGYIVLFCLPGHINRMTDTLEMELYLPEYANWSLWKKLYHGYTSTVANVFLHHNTITILVYFLVFLLCLARGTLLGRILSPLPLAGFLCLKLLNQNTLLRFITDMPELSPTTTPAGLAGFAFCGFCLICLVISLWDCVRQEHRYLLLGLLILGGGSRLLMGMSPTLYASSYRTFTYLLFSLIACCLVLLQKMKVNSSKNTYSAAVAGILLALLL
ncbi:MAG: hypothetical protein IKB80_05550 [Oscillospiraceae bacterium]|nr:hypothetical protein [Oscillospiraceae bacterium]